MAIDDLEVKSPSLRSGNNIKVVARFRPLNEVEQQSSGANDICHFEAQSVSISVGKDVETYSFDRVYQPGSSQVEVFDFVGKSIIEDVIGGYNGTVFAYGQTGTGKTYTMMGDDFYSGELKGITPRAASQIFETVSRSDNETEYIFKCSMLEIYKEKLRDLLNPGSTSLRIKECPHKGIYVQGLTEVCVTSEEEMLEVISLGEQMRTVAMTKLNPLSSRSHQLFVLEARQKSSDGSEKRGILNLVDLAGSEKVSYSGVTGNSLEETKKINLSLSALGNVIHALTAGSEHVPYRDSKLTRLLEESLGGNYKTTLIVACSPALRNIDETLNTLRFATRAKNIKNKAHVNIKSSPDDLAKTIKVLQDELANARRELQQIKMGKINETSTSTEYKPVFSPQSSPSALTIEKLRTTSTIDTFDPISTLRGEDEVSPKPSSIEPDSLNSSLIGGGNELKNTDLDKLLTLRDYYDAKLSVANQEVASLNEEVTYLKGVKQELEAKVSSSRAKQLSAEKRSYEYSEMYHKALSLINKDSAENALLKKQVSSLQRQVKRLAACLQDMEFRFGISLSNLQKHEDVTSVEFEDQFHIYLCEDDEDETILSSLPNLSFATKDLPLDTETLLHHDSYAEIAKQSSGANREALVYTLRNQLITAGLINCNMALSLRSLKWRNSLLQEKYSMRKAACSQRVNQVGQLEEMLDKLHDSYLSIVSLQDKVTDTEQSRNFRSAESSTKRKIFLRSVTSKCVRRGPRKVTLVPSYMTIDSREKSMIGESSKQFSFLECSSAEFQPLYTKVKALETNCNLQYSYNSQLKQQLQEAKAEASKYQELIDKLEKRVTEAHKSERKLWHEYLSEFKANCESELIKKHEELLRLHGQLSMWMTKHGVGIEKLAFEELRQVFKNVQTPKSQPEGLFKISELLTASPVWSQTREREFGN